MNWIQIVVIMVGGVVLVFCLGLIGGYVWGGYCQV